MIRSFLFDMGNVLVFFSHERMCENIGALCGRTGPEVKRLLLDSGLQWDFERGTISDVEFHSRFETSVGQSVGFDALLQAGSDIFELNESILPVLDALKRNGHRLVLLSNTSSAHFDWVSRQYSVLNRFDEFVVSYRVGALKPDSAIFSAALHAIQCEPEQCFYTDDIPAYVEAGRRCGFQAEVFTTTTELMSQLLARGLSLQVKATDAARQTKTVNAVETGCSEYAESA